MAMVQTLFLLAGVCLLVDFPRQLLVLGQPLKLSQIQLALKLPHAENLVTLSLVFSENQ